jgi:hypothetical protein
MGGRVWTAARSGSDLIACSKGGCQKTRAVLFSSQSDEELEDEIADVRHVLQMLADFLGSLLVIPD